MKKIINFYKRLTFFQGAACTLGLTSIVGIAATVSPLTIFTSGSTISSSQVNDNFNKLKVAIESTSSQTYMGTHDASTAVDPAGGTGPGEYYIINTAGTINAVSYNVGDWIMFDGTSWGRVPSSSLITSVFGRTGAIAAIEGDYDLHKLADVDLSAAPTAGQSLIYDGVKWVAQNITIPSASVTSASLSASSVNSTAIASGSVLSSHIMDGVIMNADISASAAIDLSKVNIPAGSIPYDRLLISSGEIPYTKIGGLPAPTDILGPISNGDTVHAPTSDEVYDTFAMKMNLTGGTLSVGTINGVPVPVSGDDVANKAYVDSSQPWSHNGGDLYLGAGNLGIGTNSPTYKLQVFGDVFASPSFISDAFSTASIPALKSSSSMNTGVFFPIASTMAISTGGTERMRIDNAGNVGIGTSTPAYMLSVNGSIGAVGTLQTVSDIRFKKNIEVIPNALEKILQINGVSYQFKTESFPDKNFSHHRELGVIAQTVEKIFPEAVSKDSKGFRSVAYSMLISPIIEAIRELDHRTQKFDELEAENKMLKDYLCAKDPNAPFCE